MRAGDWKLQVEARRDKKWLYDLGEDPTEQTNLAGSRPDKLAELLALLEQHHAGARDLLWQPTTERPIAVDKTLAKRLQPGDEVVYWSN